MQTIVKVRTPRPKQVLDVTGEVERALAEVGARQGLCNLFVQHTTAALTVGEAIEGTDEDLMETLVKLIPKIDFRHGHDPSHAPDHMIASIVGQSLTLPLAEGKLRLGTWQRVLLVECNGPRERSIVVTVVGTADRR
jgi:secondary thiamine-phosphate synthase enzyme